MSVLSSKSFNVQIDTLTNDIDIQRRLMDAAVHDKHEIITSPLLRLHTIRTTVDYYEQIVSEHQGNVVNTAPLNDFDPNLTRYRKITNFVILIPESVNADIQQDIATEINFTGTAKILPNTLVPNTGDMFVMKLFTRWHIFKVNNIVVYPIEENSGYEIEFSLYKQDIQIEFCELNSLVKETYTFLYEHVGTDFRTILKDEETRFVKYSRNLIELLTDSYVGEFYQKTLNTIMIQVGDLPSVINNQVNTIVLQDYNNMVGQTVLEERTIYDIELISFINKFDLFNMSKKINYLSMHIKPDPKFYNKCIFFATETQDISRFINRGQRLIYMNSNLYNHQNRLYGRFLVEHDTINPADPFVLNLFPTNFITKLTTYVSPDITTLQTLNYTYSNITDLFCDIIATFINEKDKTKRVNIIIKMFNYLYDNFINQLGPEVYDEEYLMFYTYPLVIYVFKFLIREVSLIKFQ